MPPRNSTDFLELAKNCTFLDRKLISALDEDADGHYLTYVNQMVKTKNKLLHNSTVVAPNKSLMLVMSNRFSRKQ